MKNLLLAAALAVAPMAAQAQSLPYGDSCKGMMQAFAHYSDGLNTANADALSYEVLVQEGLVRLDDQFRSPILGDKDHLRDATYYALQACTTQPEWNVELAIGTGYLFERKQLGKLDIMQAPK